MMDTEQLQKDLDATIELVDRQTAKIIEQAAEIEELKLERDDITSDLNSIVSELHRDIERLNARIAELEDIIMEMAEDISSDDRIAPFVALFNGDKPIEGHQAYLAAIIIYYAEKAKEKKDAKQEIEKEKNNV